MKIAFCLYGLIGSSEKYGLGKKPNDHIKLYNSFKNNVLLKNSEFEIDVFIHSWSSEFKNDILDMYKPKKFLFQKQKKLFSWKIFFRYLRANYRNINFYLGLFKLSKFKLSPFFIRIHSVLSRWKSTRTSLSLMREYEKENNFNYDIVVSSRIDLFFIRPFILKNKFINKVFFPVFNEYHTHDKIKKIFSSKDIGITNEKISDLIIGGNRNSILKLESNFKNVKNGSVDFSPHFCSFHNFKKEINEKKYELPLIPGRDICVGRDVNFILK